MIEFLLLLYAASFFLSAFFQYEVILSFASAVAVHEAGHMIAARLLSVRCTGPQIIGPDARIYLGNTGRILRETCILIAGPMTNIVASMVALLIFGSDLFLFAALSYAMAVINLLPISHLDGGRMLSLAVSSFALTGLYVILDVISLICSLSLALFTSYRMLRYGDSFFSFAAVWCWLFRRHVKSEKSNYRELLKE